MADDLSDLQISINNCKLKLTEIVGIVRGLKLSLNALDNKLKTQVYSPENSYYSASELNQKQIDTLFIMYPWMQFLVLVDKKIITRVDWEKSKHGRVS